MTSSQTIKMPYLSHSARTPGRYPSGGMMTPLVPVTVSRMMAAMLFGFS